MQVRTIERPGQSIHRENKIKSIRTCGAGVRRKKRQSGRLANEPSQVEGQSTDDRGGTGLLEGGLLSVADASAPGVEPMRWRRKQSRYPFTTCFFFRFEVLRRIICTAQNERASFCFVPASRQTFFSSFAPARWLEASSLPLLYERGVAGSAVLGRCVHSVFCSVAVGPLPQLAPR